MRTYGKYLQLTSTVIFGGVGMNPQISQAARRAWTSWWPPPAACWTCSNRASLDLGQVQILVLDEADRMLDMGFIHDVKKVLALVPKDKQSLLFSATFSDEIRELANGLLKNPQSVQVTPRNTTVQRITQVIHPVGRGKKKALLAHIINEHNWSQVLVFTRTKFGANNVAEFLEKNGITAMALHGNKSQAARTQALAGFKSGDVRALVATDIAARGIDIDDLPHVVNYEIPNVSEDYVHRIGRTGRAGCRWRRRQPGVPGRRRLHAGHRALHQAEDRSARWSRVSAPSRANTPSPSPWAARPSGAAPASRRAAT